MGRDMESKATARFLAQALGGCGWQREEQVGASPMNLALSKCLQAPRSSSILTSEFFLLSRLRKEVTGTRG